MAVVVVFGVALTVLLLWRILRVQEARATMEASRLVADDARETRAAFQAKHGTLEQARANGRVTEYVRDHYATFDGGAPELLWHETKRWAERQPELARDLEREARARGVRCELFEEWWGRRGDGPVYPGPEPTPEMTCAELCGDSINLPALPPEFKACPYCASALAPFDDDVPRVKADRDAARQKWDQFKQFFPLHAADAEAEWLAEDQRYRAEYVADAWKILLRQEASDAETDADPDDDDDDNIADEDLHILTPEARRIVAAHRQ